MNRMWRELAIRWVLSLRYCFCALVWAALTVSLVNAEPASAGRKSVPKFKEYPAKIMQVQKAPLHLERDDLMFRTRIRAAYRTGPNFAGHYAVSEVGCGTFCSFLIVVDVATGRTVSLDVPSGEDLYVCGDQYIAADDTLPGSIGNKFYYRPDSRLFVVTGQMPGNECGARYFVESGGRMMQIRDLHLQPQKAKP